MCTLCILYIHQTNFILHIWTSSPIPSLIFWICRLWFDHCAVQLRFVWRKGVHESTKNKQQTFCLVSGIASLHHSFYMKKITGRNLLFGSGAHDAYTNIRFHNSYIRTTFYEQIYKMFSVPFFGIFPILDSSIFTTLSQNLSESHEMVKNITANK